LIFGAAFRVPGTSGSAFGAAGLVFCALGISGGALALTPVAPESVWGGTLSAQTPTMPSTLRYGSGLMDIPVSSVLPHMTITGTFSGFFSQLGRRIEIDEAGTPSGFGPGRDDFLTDGSVAIGLFDRAEAGITVQSLAAADEGGNIWGLFGRLRLWEPIDQGVGLAVGGRYLTSPTFGDGVTYSPGRLGFADDRLREDYTDIRGMDTNVSLYAVATAYLRGYDGGILPENDMTFSFGYGGGMFSEGGDLDFYADGRTSGWFVGTALHIGMGQRSQLTVMAEHNGFDVNLGAQFDWDGVRIGAQYLAANHDWPPQGHYSEYQKPKFGIMLSLAICPNQAGFRCRPTMMRRTEPDTVFIPPPPPDTIVVRVVDGGAPMLRGEASSICLSTGQNVPIEVTEAGDTLVGPGFVPVRQLRPGLVFAGAYAGNAFWYQDGEVIIFEGGDFGRSADTFPIDCDQVLRVGIYQGVPVFAVVSAARPLEVIFIPVSPGVWRRYERGLRRSPTPSDFD
jgi:hypothetical protein